MKLLFLFWVFLFFGFFFHMSENVFCYKARKVIWRTNNMTCFTLATARGWMYVTHS